MEHKDSMGRGVQIRKIKKMFSFPTLFSRLVTVYISMLIVMLVILFLIFTHAFQAYFVRYTKDLMFKQAESIASEYVQAAEYTSSKEEALHSVLYHIRMMDNYLKATTWLIDKEGQVVMITEDANKKVMDETLPDTKEIDEVFKGSAIGIENGFTEYFSTPVLTIGYPIKMDGKVELALFVHTPMPFVLKNIDEVRQTVLRAVTIIGAGAFGWIYVISKRITEPLKKMNEVAKVMAGGQFDQRIKLEGRDEVAELAFSFNNMAKELDKIEENRRQLIANVSHDLRSPLTSIQGFVTAILDGTISAEKQEHYLKIVLSESQRMIDMANTILELNKVQENRQPVEKNIFNIITMFERILPGIEERLNEKKIHLEKDLDKAYPWVVADIDGINRVIYNLLDNALKFVDEGGTIKIFSQLRHHKLWIGISNTGAYIPKEEQKKIWERFYKGDQSRGKDKKGVGLGLVIVKEILRQNQEVIGVRSKPGEPVVFYFSLDVVRR